MKRLATTEIQFISNPVSIMQTSPSRRIKVQRQNHRSSQLYQSQSLENLLIYALHFLLELVF